jgi:hypothetical protein
MPTESNSLTEQRIRKEKALCGLRELQLRQAEGRLLNAVEVERTWSEAVIRMLQGFPIRNTPKRSFAPKWKLR